MTGISVRFPAPFPATVAGQGGIAVEKENGVWIIAPDFGALAELLPAALVDPATRQIWVYDPVAGAYNVLTLAGLGEALHAATSATSLAVGTGARTFVTQAAKDFAPGSFVLATSAGDPSNYMLGQVTAYAGTSLTIAVEKSNGSGTHADWTLRASGPAGPPGAGGPGYAATSASSVAIGIGPKSFTTQAGLAYSAGARARASAAADTANSMEGLVTGYAGTTLTINVTRTSGSGTHADWTLNLAGDPGTGDLLAANNLSDVANAAAARTNLGLGASEGPQFASVNLGHASDTTLSRAAAGVIAVEGVPLYSQIPQQSKSADYTLVLADAQKHVLHPSTDNSPRTFTIPANASVAFPIGTAVTFVNKANTVTIAIASDTLTMAGTGLTGGRTLAANGMATAVKIGATEWMIFGAALS